MQIYYIFLEYEEYIFYHLWVCINGILQYASFYNPTFSLSLFLRSVNNDMYIP